MRFDNNLQHLFTQKKENCVMIESRIKSFMCKDNYANFLRTEKLYIIATYYSERGAFGWTALEKRCIKNEITARF